MTIKRVERRTYEILQDSTAEQKATLTAVVNSDFTLLEALADSIISVNESDIDNIINRMKNIQETSNFLFLGIAKEDGIAYLSNDDMINISDYSFYKDAFLNKNSIYPCSINFKNKVVTLIFSVPLKENNRIIGTIFAGFTSEQLTTFIISSAFEGEAYSYVCDTDGNIIINAEKDLIIENVNNVFSLFRQVKLGKSLTVDDIINDFKNNKSGIVVCSYKNEKRYAVYEPLNNDWYILNVVDSSIVDIHLREQTILGISLITVITISFVLLLTIIVLHERKGAKEIEKMQEKQLNMYITDSLTGLYNFNGFEKVVRNLLNVKQVMVKDYIIDFDIDFFKMYNSLYGFESGNHLLCDIAQICKTYMNNNETIARLSSDHFVIYIQSNDDNEMLKRIDEIYNAIIKLTSGSIINISMGVYQIIDKTLSINDMIDRARLAKSTIKRNYEIYYAIYDDKLHEYQKENMDFMLNMENALLNNEFIAYYQPKYDTKTKTIIGAEALVRWVKPDGSFYKPDRFISLFEKNGLISKLDCYMFENVCKELSKMIQNGINPVPVSVNFSRAHLFDGSFANRLYEIAQKYNITTNLLEIELTESAFLNNSDILLQVINSLHEKGFVVSLDDFGSGYSSLNMLKDMAFDIIKLDRGFLSTTTVSGKGKKVIKSILDLAKSLNLKTVAEGVETEEQYQFLLQNGCDIIQGYYFNKPMIVDDFIKLIK